MRQFSKNIFILLLLYIFSMSSFAMTSQEKKIPVILDTDIGSDIDDMWALIMLLNSPEFDIKLITTAVGDTATRAKLVAKVLQIADRTEIPVGIGPQKGKAPVRQAGWIADFDMDKYKGTVLKNGAQAIVDVIMASKEKVKLIAIGPLPTVEAALKIEPKIAQKAEFIGMQGSIAKKYPEFNVKIWPSGLREVLKADWQRTITPLDTCAKVKLTGQRYQKVVKADTPLTNALIEAYRQWYPIQNWIDPNEIIPEKSSSILYDTVAIYLAISEDLLNVETRNIYVNQRNYTLVDDTKGFPVRCALTWKDLDAFEEFLLNRIIAKKGMSSCRKKKQ